MNIYIPIWLDRGEYRFRDSKHQENRWKEGQTSRWKGTLAKITRKIVCFLSLRTDDGHEISSPLLKLMDRVKYDHQVDQTNTEVDFKVNIRINNEISIKQWSSSEGVSCLAVAVNIIMTSVGFRGGATTLPPPCHQHVNTTSSLRPGVALLELNS